MKGNVSAHVSGVVDSMPFRYVTAFLGTKPYAKQIGRSGMLLREVLSIMKYKSVSCSLRPHEFEKHNDEWQSCSPESRNLFSLCSTSCR